VKLTPIQVESYAGHEPDETPRRFFTEGEWIEISEVLDRWYQTKNQPEWPQEARATRASQDAHFEQSQVELLLHCPVHRQIASGTKHLFDQIKPSQ
jgi:hypothetical protein